MWGGSGWACASGEYLTALGLTTRVGGVGERFWWMGVGKRVGE